MHVYNLLHRRAVREANVVEEAAAEKRVRQLLLIVGGNNDDWAVPGGDGALRLVDIEFHTIELKEQIVRELDICLVDLVDQEYRSLGRLERLPQFPGHDIVGDVVDALVA